MPMKKLWVHLNVQASSDDILPSHGEFILVGSRKEIDVRKASFTNTQTHRHLKFSFVEFHDILDNVITLH